jgi:predicted Zn-dependent protease
MIQSIRTRQTQVAGMLMLAAAAAGCARNPVTGQLQLALITEAQEVEMGRQGSEQVVRSIGLVPDQQLQDYVQRLGQQMAQSSERPELPWTFGVVDDPTPNAFALPGGFIYFTRGMMNLMSTEAQLASVLGHEIGHVTARHHVTQMSRIQLAQVGLGVAGVLFPDLQQLGGLAGAGLQVLFLQHSRSAERQADDLGFNYALAQGYDVNEMAAVFATLQRMSEDQQQSSALPPWLLTHPEPGARIQVVQERIAALDPQPVGLEIGREQYLARLDGLVYGVNPRNGFFRDGAFLHPDLRFRLAFPADWPRQNLAQMVMAVSPRQDAAIQLTLSADATPAAAAQRFLGQQGVRPGQSASQTINGLPAVVATFQAQTEGGILQGIAAFISHENRVYQLLTYSPVAVYGQYQTTFQQSIGSFARLTDQAVLDIQPNRVRIVQTPQNMTLAQFHARYPSVIPIAELAVINQLEGPDTTIPAGSRIKRVVAGQ